MRIDCAEITQEAQGVIESHALRVYPEECCGVLLGRSGGGRIVVMSAVESPNLAEAGRRAHRYVVDPLVIVKTDRTARLEGLEIVGFYHSHPNCAALASATDADSSWDYYIYLIVSASKEKISDMRGWARQEEKPSEMYEITMLSR